MTESFGAELRRQREQRHVALATMAERTKIGLSLLEALERDDLSRWPSGIFRRAFVRAYAQAVGLEPDLLVRRFLECHPDPLDDVDQVSALATRAGGSAAPPTRFRYLVGSAISALRQAPAAGGQEPRAAGGDVGTAGAAPMKPAMPADPDLPAVAELCTAVSGVDHPRDAAPLLQQVVGMLDAIGLVVWTWDPQAAELSPVVAHGYSPEVLARLPTIARDADNATAAAFRLARTCVVHGRDAASGALAVPLMTPGGCAGVLAIETRPGAEERESVRALAVIFAAQLARMIAVARPAVAADRRLA